ncbi:hypothetical protein HK097_011387 [Rhizophlyctis rosea]|uniref:F-box domain-containing protein n=1 Tax=Rhizophlyctis rosea TaxID=64517 RepID=A0AAD5S6H2_9FUNG|nr:hypothetical protein HK097_011387 [Rhizophlyctis rosea]
MTGSLSKMPRIKLDLGDDPEYLHPLLKELQQRERQAAEAARLKNLSNCPIAKLPAELISMIFGYVGGQALLLKIAETCRLFNICVTPLLYRFPKFRNTFQFAQFNLTLTRAVNTRRFGLFVQVLDLSGIPANPGKEKTFSPCVVPLLAQTTLAVKLRVLDDDTETTVSQGTLVDDDLDDNDNVVDATDDTDGIDMTAAAPTPNSAGPSTASLHQWSAPLTALPSHVNSHISQFLTAPPNQASVRPPSMAAAMANYMASLQSAHTRLTNSLFSPFIPSNQLPNQLSTAGSASIPQSQFVTPNHPLFLPTAYSYYPPTNTHTNTHTNPIAATTAASVFNTSQTNRRPSTTSEAKPRSANPQLTIETSTLLQIAKHCPNLQFLSLAHSSIHVDVLIKETGDYLSSLAQDPPPYLTQVPIYPADAVRKIVEGCRELKSLDLRGCEWVDVGLVEGVVGAARELRALNLGKCEGLKGKKGKEGKEDLRRLWVVREGETVGDVLGEVLARV